MAGMSANGRSKASSGPRSPRCRSDQIQVRPIGLAIVGTRVSRLPASASSLSQ